MSAAVLHVIVAVAALAAYVVLTVTGNDGTPALAFLGGQVVGAGAQKVATNGVLA